MIYATIFHDEKEQLCCIDGVGARVFLLKDFFDHALSPGEAPSSMIDFIRSYEAEWTDIALLGSVPSMLFP